MTIKYDGNFAKILNNENLQFCVRIGALSSQQEKIGHENFDNSEVGCKKKNAVNPLTTVQTGLQSNTPIPFRKSNSRNSTSGRCHRN